jgi:hypothetical protein
MHTNFDSQFNTKTNETYNPYLYEKNYLHHPFSTY